MPTPPGKIKLRTYADKSTALNSGLHIKPLCDELNKYLETLNIWFKSRNLFISAPKSSATLITTFSNELAIDLPIYIDGIKVPTKKDPKILGVILDPLLKFNPHVTHIRNQQKSRNNLIKCIWGATWGKEKET